MKLTLQLATSLDGYIARTDGGFDWCFTDQDYGMGDFLASIDAVVMGRNCFDLLQQLGEKPGTDKQYYVLTHHKPEIRPPNFHFVDAPVEQLYLRMRDEGVRHAWLFGGSNVCGQFASADLIDDCVVAMHPIALGTGVPLFSGLARDLKLKLRDSKIYDTGLIMLHYDVKRSTQ
jgi:dihydrofolate reductase